MGLCGVKNFPIKWWHMLQQLPNKGFLKVLLFRILQFLRHFTNIPTVCWFTNKYREGVTYDTTVGNNKSTPITLPTHTRTQREHLDYLLTKEQVESFTCARVNKITIHVHSWIFFFKILMGSIPISMHINDRFALKSCHPFYTLRGRFWKSILRYLLRHKRKLLSTFNVSISHTSVGWNDWLVNLDSGHLKHTINYFTKVQWKTPLTN